MTVDAVVGEIIHVEPIVYTTTELGASDRVAEVVQAFRFLGRDRPGALKLEVIPGFAFRLGQVTVIAGPSGSGKSSLLRVLMARLACRQLPTLASSLADVPVIEQVGRDVADAIGKLSRCGLGEGNLFLRRPYQLSDGQRYRLRLALELDREANGTTLAIDEFGGPLDPVTARALAMSLAAVMRATGRHLIACCNDEITAKAFKPDTLISLTYDGKATVSYPTVGSEPGQTVRLTVQSATVRDYERFRKYHYLDVDDRMNRAELYKATLDGTDVGIHVCVRPIEPHLAGRHPYLLEINRRMLSGYRTVVHPEYRGIGVAKMLWEEAARLSGAEVIEGRSAFMAYVPFPLQWGFREYEDPWFLVHPARDALTEYLQEMGVTPFELLRAERVQQVLVAANHDKLAQLLLADLHEKFRSKIYYYCHIMADCGFPFVGDLDLLIDSYLSGYGLPTTTLELSDMLKMVLRPRSRAFYLSLAGSYLT
jgi:ABC-type lipoprotein export system ATPase subunit/GNAT superfamily N-acetyltransferase